MSTTTISTSKRVKLRTLEDEDAAFYLELHNDPSFIENIRDKGIRTLEDAKHAIRTAHNEVQERQGFSLFLVERLEDGAALGLCGLVKRDNLPGIDIGYALLPQYWGQSYAFEACTAVLRFAADSIKLKELYAIVSPHNIASSKLLEKLGFQMQKTISLSEGDPVKLFHIDLRIS
ncbi:GNAT family N-acetyltransferase [Undibacterium sp. LX40W]|uniref:GNAT family N-acetyltransferase n=1 Tax=Undibacterium nitidum TaxID=2762298 RepID=A0A923HVV7_9BURK|nr:GNAT family N-acetyltransferase [Undibacterium nitidum]MBC3882309.1 GNAT family N-acetyltransferase [Undibacterium nitidum]MBC3892590.1 GNAT family N-acetyltransferase [Undibacterium sp. LX40W]